MSAPHLVILDSDPTFGSSASRGGALSLAPLETCGTVTSYPNTSPEQILLRAGSAEVILTNKVVLGEAEISRLPALKLISVLATGVNVIDLAAAARHGVTVCNVPGYSTASTAQHTIALLLEITNQVGLHAQEVRAGKWEESPAFSYFRGPLMELSEKTLGIVGYGAIGVRVGEIARALGMRILVHTRTQKASPGVTFVDKETLLSESDVVCLHCPLTKATEGFIDEAALAQMKPGAILINAARGPVVHEGAVAAALASGQLGYFASDVLSKEPPQGESPLLRAPGTCLTPHIAWASVEARSRLIEQSAENIRAFYRKSPINVVLPPG